MIDPNDWLPLLGVGLLIVTTVTALGGAWAMGRARGLRDAARLQELERENRDRIHDMVRVTFEPTPGPQASKDH